MALPCECSLWIDLQFPKGVRNRNAHTLTRTHSPAGSATATMKFWVDIPLIPMVLIGARLRIFDSMRFWLPTLVAIPVAHPHFPLPFSLWLSGASDLHASISYSSYSSIDSDTAAFLGAAALDGLHSLPYPPSPVTTLLLAPWFRAAYAWLKRSLYLRVLGSKGLRRRSSARAAATTTARRVAPPPAPAPAQVREQEQRAGAAAVAPPAIGEAGADRPVDRRVVLLDTRADENDFARAPDPAPGVAAVQEELVPRQGAGERQQQQQQGEQHEPAGAEEEEQEGDDEEAEEEEEGEDGFELQQTVYVTPTSVGKLFLGALGVPFVASAMGDLLKRTARYSSWLQRFLGLRAEHFVARGGGGGGLKHGQAASSAQGAWGIGGGGGAGEWNPLRALLNKIKATAAKWSPSALTAAGRKAQLAERGGPYAGLEPVWWRNAIGLALYTVVKDAAVLLYRYQRVQQKGRLRVRDIPFDPKLVAGLDLR